MQAPVLLLGLVSLHVQAHGELLQNFSLFRLLTVCCLETAGTQIVALLLLFVSCW